MSEREPSPDVLGALNELRGEVGEVRIGLGDVRGRLERLDGTVAEQGERLDRLGDEVNRQGERLDRLGDEMSRHGERLGRLGDEMSRQGERLDRVDDRLVGLTGEVATMKRELPAQIVAGVLMGFERSAYVSDLRTLQREMDQVKADVAELKRASGK